MYTPESASVGQMPTWSYNMKEHGHLSNLPVLVKLSSWSIVPVYSPFNSVCKYFSTIMGIINLYSSQVWSEKEHLTVLIYFSLKVKLSIPHLVFSTTFLYCVNAIKKKLYQLFVKEKLCHNIKIYFPSSWFLLESVVFFPVWSSFIFMKLVFHLCLQC